VVCRRHATISSSIALLIETLNLWHDGHNPEHFSLVRSSCCVVAELQELGVGLRSCQHEELTLYVECKSTVALRRTMLPANAILRHRSASSIPSSAVSPTRPRTSTSPHAACSSRLSVPHARAPWSATTTRTSQTLRTSRTWTCHEATSAWSSSASRSTPFPDQPISP